ncbi:MAG TPA: HD domain-containing protein [Chitinophagaceae bacterium]|nr:HD domain-containing protein [Chitinophagaceae bacterium]
MLRTGLDPRLTYHSPAHTEDVLRNVERIAAAENITDARLLLLMKIAALFHDTGFLRTYKGHEQQSCLIMQEIIDTCQFDEVENKIMNGMIMATKIPQAPKTLPEMIICDADLDYLGRDDFEAISNSLKDEFLIYHVIKSEEEWDRLQVNFFESHRYFTASSLQDRYPVKMKHLEMLKQKLLQ